MNTDEPFDVAIIGGGIVGCATVFHLTNNGYRCILLEKNRHLITGASAGNSGMLHTGFDAPLRSLELRCIQESQKQIYEILNKLELPCNRIGATMIAWDQIQLSKLPAIIHNSHQALVQEVQQLSISELYQREPNLAVGATGAIHIPGEAIIDPWLTPVSFAEHARARGAKICTQTVANNFDFNESTGIWTISSDRGQIKSHLVINCGGLYGDIVDRLVGYNSFRIKPRKGQYIIFDKIAKGLVSSSLLPVPTETTKGVIVFKSMYENTIIGPTAEETDDRCATPIIDQNTTSRLKDHGQKTVPSLMSHKVVRMYTGVRPATENKDYQIIPRVDRNWLTVGGIRSTGLSACIGIADYSYSLVKENFGLEPSGVPWNSLDKIHYTFSNRGTAEFQNGVEHLITHPLTLTGLVNQCIPNSNL